MAAVSLPITFRALASPALNTPMAPITPTVSSLQSDELLIKISYASINPSDAKIQQSNFLRAPYPLILGFDFSGVVVAVGGEASSTAADPAITVGSAVFGFTMGAFTEYAVVNRAHVLLRGAIPEVEASCYGGVYPSAYEPLEMQAHMSKRAGQSIFIPGGAGGVGHFAVQMAKAAGMKVITSASKPDGLALLKSLGIPHVLDYSKVDVVAEVLGITGGKGVDLVFDATYVPSSMVQSASTVASGGVWLRLGDFKADDEEARNVAAGRGATALFGSFGRYVWDPQFRPQLPRVMQGMAEVVKLYEEGKVRPHVSAIIPFEAEAVQQAVDAIAANKMNVGKVTVKVAQWGGALSTV